MLDIFTKGGLLMWPIGACSIVALAIVIHKAFQFRVSTRLVGLTPAQALSSRPALLTPLLDAVNNGENERKSSLWEPALCGRWNAGSGHFPLFPPSAPFSG